MAHSNLNEEENKPNQCTSVKFLLKQVYGAHISKVRALEAELKELKESKSGALKRDVPESNYQCNHCKDLQKALNSSRQECKETIIKQSEKLEYLEQQLILLQNRNMRLPETEVHKQNHLPSMSICTKEQTAQKNVINDLKVLPSNNSEAKSVKSPCIVFDESICDGKIEISSVVSLKSEESSPYNKEHMFLKTKKVGQSFYDNESFSSQLQNSFCDYFPQEPNIVLVPETLDTTEYITSKELSPMCFSKSYVKPVNEFESPTKFQEINQQGKLNNHEKKAKKLSRKRAYSTSPFKDKKISKKHNNNISNELPKVSKSPAEPLNELYKSPVKKLSMNVSKKENLSIVSNINEKYIDTNITSVEKIHTNGKKEDSNINFNNYLDSSEFTLKTKSPSLLNSYNSKQMNTAFSSKGSDNICININDSKLSQTSVKPVKLEKKSKNIKSVSHLKIILDAPNIDFRKPQYKQTKLSRTLFKQAKHSIKNTPNSPEKIKIEISDQNETETAKSVLETKDTEAGKISSKTIASKNAWEVHSIASKDEDKLLISDIDATFLPENCKFSEQMPVISHVNDTECDNINSPIALDPERTCIEYENIDILESPIDHDSEDLLQAVKNEISEKEAHSEERKKDQSELIDTEEIEKLNINESFDSFDIMPSPQKPNYKYKEDPVRKKDKRRQLKGYDCKECEKYYSGLGLSKEEKEQRLKQCSRHRAMHVPPSTPEHFWELEFPDTEECKARGYLAETQKIKLKSRRRRPLK